MRTRSLYVEDYDVLLRACTTLSIVLYAYYTCNPISGGQIIHTMVHQAQLRSQLTGTRFSAMQIKPGKPAFYGCQYIVELCVETQNPSKLSDSTDDKLTVSGMHNKAIGFTTLISKITKKRPATHMLKQINNTPEEQQDRLDAIRLQLSEDDYFVDSLQIADKIIDIELALAGSN